MVIPYYCEDYPEVWDEFNSFWDDAPSADKSDGSESAPTTSNDSSSSPASDPSPLTADVKPSEKLP
ncbi:MAG: hypothetical protein IJF84_08090 [Thermoguttaceae bacterium]|nr:hypothetical protein [Thermoguttaceae bacterium]